MIEFEFTFLPKELPEGLTECHSEEMVDLYIENGAEHADLRVRKQGERYELTRKAPISSDDASAQREDTIVLLKEEFQSFMGATHRKVEKTRYYYDFEGVTYEFDVFSGPLKGLVTVDIEFGSEEAQQKYTLPDFCLADITQEEFIAGGMLAGKSYTDIEEKLAGFGYEALIAH